MNIKKIRKEDNDFPQSLIEFNDCPKQLYLINNKNIDLTQYKKVAIVGSRDASKYSLDIAYKFAYELAKNNIVIVSGMARGIDSAAHKGALDANGLTVAVLGNGLDICYPPENKILMEKIIENGMLISEYSPGVNPYKNNFPARNRIISGLCDFVLVVEAKERSGSLITARIALDYGIDVGVIPANINNECSKGSNSLLRDGAFPVLEIRDILEQL